MAKVFKDFNEMSAAFKKMADDFTKESKEILEYNIGEMELEAIRDAPGPGALIDNDYGTPETQESIARGRSWTPISQAIGYTIDPSGLKGTVYVEKSAGELAIYVEAGTGQSARAYIPTVPKEFQDVFRKYYLTGYGTILAKPYMLPAYFKYSVLFKKEMTELVKNVTFK